MDTIVRAWQKHYLFGGNPGEVTNRSARLGDFWKLTLHKPCIKDLLNRILFLVRKQKYLELCATDHISALKYLQNQVAEVTNHNDPAHSTQFRKLASCLCQPREGKYNLMKAFKQLILQLEMFLNKEVNCWNSCSLSIRAQ